MCNRHDNGVIVIYEEFLILWTHTETFKGEVI